MKKERHRTIRPAGWLLTLLSLVGVVRPKDGRPDAEGSSLGGPAGGTSFQCKSKKDLLPQTEQESDERKNVKTKRNKVEPITDRDRGPNLSCPSTSGPSTSTESLGMGASHQVQASGNVQSEKVSRTCQTSSVHDLPAVNPDSFNSIIQFLEKLTEEQWKQLRVGCADPAMKTLLARMMSESIQFVSESSLEVIMRAVDRFVRMHGPAPPVSTKRMSSDVQVCKRAKKTLLQICKRAKKSFSRRSSSSSSNGSQTGLPRTQGDSEFKSSEPLRDLFGITVDRLLSGVKDSFGKLLSNFPGIRRVQVDTETLFRVIVEDVSKKVNSIIAVIIQTPRSTGQEGPIIFASGGLSNIKVIEEMVSGTSIVLQMFINGQSLGEQNVVFKHDDVEKDTSDLTGQVMTALTDTASICSDIEREKDGEKDNSQKTDLLCVVSDNTKALASRKSSEAKLKHGQAHLGVKGAESSISLSAQNMDKLLTEKCQTKATNSIRAIIRRFCYYLTCFSIPMPSTSTPSRIEIVNFWDTDASESIRSSSCPAQRAQVLIDTAEEIANRILVLSMSELMKEGLLSVGGSPSEVSSVASKIDFFGQQQPVLANVAEIAKRHESVSRMPTAIMSGTEHETRQTMESYSKAFVRQSLMSIQSEMTISKELSTSAEGLLTYSIVSSMLKEFDGMSGNSNVGLGTHQASSSKSSHSITSAKSRASQSDDFQNSLPGTSIPNEWPVSSDFPIIRSSVIDMGKSSMLPKAGKKEKKTSAFFYRFRLLSKHLKKINLNDYWASRPSQNQTPAVCKLAVVNNQNTGQRETVYSTMKKPRKQSSFSGAFSDIRNALSSLFTSCFKGGSS